MRTATHLRTAAQSSILDNAKAHDHEAEANSPDGFRRGLTLQHILDALNSDATAYDDFPAAITRAVRKTYQADQEPQP